MSSLVKKTHRYTELPVSSLETTYICTSLFFPDFTSNTYLSLKLYNLEMCTVEYNFPSSPYSSKTNVINHILIYLQIFFYLNVIGTGFIPVTRPKQVGLKQNQCFSLRHIIA